MDNVKVVRPALGRGRGGNDLPAADPRVEGRFSHYASSRRNSSRTVVVRYLEFFVFRCRLCGETISRPTGPRERVYEYLDQIWLAGIASRRPSLGREICIEPNMAATWLPAWSAYTPRASTPQDFDNSLVDDEMSVSQRGKYIPPRETGLLV